jgi:hypothetical protein
MIQALDENHWKNIKSAELTSIIAACSDFTSKPLHKIKEAIPEALRV